jgi:hypothetical protein
MFNVFILNQIRNCLLESPGFFRWTRKAELWNIRIMDLYDHIKFLRTNGFTRNEGGRVYWREGDMSDVRGVLSKLFPDEPIVDLVTIEESPTSKPSEVWSRNDVASCARELRSLSFVGVSARDLQRRLSAPYSFVTIHKAIEKVGGTRIFSPALSCSIYYKFNAEIQEAS